MAPSTKAPSDAPTIPLVTSAVHVVAALFWGLVGAVAGERSRALSAALLAGSALVLVALMLLRNRKFYARARVGLLVADAAPLVLFVGVAIMLVVDAARDGQLAALVFDSGAALALYLPAALAPLLLAMRLPPARAQ